MLPTTTWALHPENWEASFVSHISFNSTAAGSDNQCYLDYQIIPAVQASAANQHMYSWSAIQLSKGWYSTQNSLEKCKEL